MSCLRALTDSHPLSAFLSLALIQSPKPSFLKALYNVLNTQLFQPQLLPHSQLLSSLSFSDHTMFQHYFAHSVLSV